MEKLVILIFILATSISYSQVSSSSSEMGNVEKEKYYSVMALQNWELDKLNGRKAPSGNSVFIEQVGNENIVQSNISSRDAIFNLGQAGNNNSIDLQLESQKIHYDVVQIGNNNYLLDHTYVPFKNAELNLQQNGNNNQVLKYGTNSITNKLEFNLTGDSKTLIIRSFQ